MNLNSHQRGRLGPQLLLAVFLLALSLSTAIDARSRPAAGAATALRSVMISGVVVADSEIGGPIQDAVVTLVDVDDPAFEVTARTSAEGVFSFGGLPAGRYRLSAAKPTYLPTTYGAMTPGRTGTPVALAADQQRTGIVLKLTRGGIIGGTIRDPSGAPLPGINIKLLRRVGGSAARRLAEFTGGDATTDDRGAYRIYGLPPADYAVAAIPLRLALTGTLDAASTAESERGMSAIATDSGLSARRGVGVSDSRSVGYTPLYFPGVLSADNAQLITVSLGSEQAGVDFILAELSTGSIEGIATLHDESVASVRFELSLTSAESSLAMPLWSQHARPSGSFSAVGIAPGRYVLSAYAISDARPSASLLSGSRQWWAEEEVVVRAGPPTRVSLDLKPTISVEGHVAFARVLTQPRAEPLVQIALVSLARGPHYPDRVKCPDVSLARFVCGGIIPGSYRIDAHSRAPWTLTSTVLDGVDVTDLPVNLTADSQGVILTFTEAPTVVSGYFVDASGRPATDYFIVVFTADRRYWTEHSRRIAEVRPATDGTYRLIGLPPGSYYMAAVTDVGPDDLFDESFLEALTRSSPIPLTLATGETLLQNIRLARSPGSLRRLLENGTRLVPLFLTPSWDIGIIRPSMTRW